MSSDGAIEFDWGDGRHRFRLAIGQLRELQDKCSAGPAQILQRLQDRTWRIDEPREIIRLGLIGGGMMPTQAIALVVRYFDERPFNENIIPAFNILASALVGVPDDQPKQGSSEGKEATEETTDGSASPSSMDQEPFSAGTLGSSIN